MVNEDNYDMTTSLGTAQYFGDVLEAMIGESWFRTDYPGQYAKMHDLCRNMRHIVDLEKRKYADNNSPKTKKEGN